MRKLDLPLKMPPRLIQDTQVQNKIFLLLSACTLPFGLYYLYNKLSFRTCCASRQLISRSNLLKGVMLITVSNRDLKMHSNIIPLQRNNSNDYLMCPREIVWCPISIAFNFTTFCKTALCDVFL